MKKIKLPNVTLLGIDCVNIERLIKVINISEKNIKFGAVKILTSLETSDARKIKIPEIKSIQEYSLFCINDLYKYIETDFVLIIQHDGFILNPGSWTNEFLEYDYIGATWLVANWSVKNFDFPKELLEQKIVGNGGFSLRSKKFLEISNKLYKSGEIKKTHPEDVAMCVWYRDKFEKEGIKFATAKIANKFSIEDENLEFKNQFGFHGFWNNDLNKYFKKNTKYNFLVKYIK